MVTSEATAQGDGDLEQTIAELAKFVRDPAATISMRAHLAQRAADGDAEPPPSSAALPLIELGEGKSGDFDVVEVIGEGGMGRVVLARQRSLGREVAIKVVKAGSTGDSTFGSLLDEARITGALEHPGIVPVHALGRDAEGQPVLVMKRVEGVSWREVARDPESLTRRGGDLAALGEGALEVHVEIAMATCNALHFAHAQGIVHRDVKLENVMIGRFGEIYLLDWGIAIRRADGGKKGPTVGTPTYMAPELVVGNLAAQDARTDVYLLAASVHHAVIGKPRHGGANLHQVLFAAAESAPFAYPAAVPAELASILNRATARLPADRYASALELRAALAAFRRHRGSAALGEVAAARLAELDALVTTLERERAGDDRGAFALLTECRVSFREALRAWPENEAAQRGRATCLELGIRYELTRRDVDRARALVAEFGASPALAARVDALAAEVDAERAEQERLASIGRGQDLRVGGRAQLYVIGLLAIVCGLVVVDVAEHGGKGTSYLSILVMPAAAAVLLVGAPYLLRHRLPTPISRRALIGFGMVPAGVLVHRLLVLPMGIALAPMLVGDAFIAATVCAALGIGLVRALAYPAVPFAVCGAAVAFYPSRAEEIYAVCMMSAFAALFLAWRRAVR